MFCKQTKVVLNPLRALSNTGSVDQQEMLSDTDLAGPLCFGVLFGTALLLVLVLLLLLLQLLLLVGRFCFV